MTLSTGITYTLEPWDDYFRDCQTLWLEHYAEIAGMPDRQSMSPDIGFFQFLESKGALQILTARRAGTMIGYCLVVIRRHTHYDTFCGFEDSYYLRQSERKGMVGVRLITNSLYHLRKRGVSQVFFMTKTSKDLSKLFSRLGFKHCDEVFTKWIGA